MISSMFMRMAKFLAIDTPGKVPIGSGAYNFNIDNHIAIEEQLIQSVLAMALRIGLVFGIPNTRPI